MILFSSSANLGGCQTKDSDACLQASPGWGTSYTCSSSIGWCFSWGKDLRRCCPESCGTGIFQEKDCLAFSSEGTCTYPNEAQCSVGKLPNIP